MIIDIETWNAIVPYMDDEKREQVHAEFAPYNYTYKEFLERYLELDEEFADLLKNEFGIDVDEEERYFWFLVRSGLNEYDDSECEEFDWGFEEEDEDE